VPVGAALFYVERVGKGFAGLDAGKTEPGHAIHLEREDQAVPVDRGVGGQVVGDAQGDAFAFLPAQDRCGQLAVDGDGATFAAGKVDGGFADMQVELVAAQFLRLGEQARRQAAGGKTEAQPEAGYKSTAWHRRK